MTAVSQAFTVELSNSLLRGTVGEKTWRGICSLRNEGRNEEIIHFILHYMGADIVCDELAPVNAENKFNKEMIVGEISEIYWFQCRKQQEGECVQEYVHALQKMSINCGFGTYLEKAVRNQFNFGVKSHRI